MLTEDQKENKLGSKIAFPRPYSHGYVGYDGMTLREYYACQAMLGLCTHNHKNEADTAAFVDWCAELSVEMADRLIEELEK